MDDDRYMIIRHEEGKDICKKISLVKCHLTDKRHFYEVNGGITFIRQVDGDQLKEYLRKIKRPMSGFISPKNKEVVAMVSVDKVDDIIDNDMDYQGILFVSDGKTYQFRVVVEEWRRFFKTIRDKFHNNKREAIKNMNKKDKDLYLIVYKSKQNKRPYILFIHMI